MAGGSDSRSTLGSVARRLLGRRAPTAGAAPAEMPAPIPHLGYVVLGQAGVHPGSAHIRVTRRVNAAVVGGILTASQLDPTAFVAGEDSQRYDVVLVQRDAVPGDVAVEFVEAVRRHGARLVLEVDDDFFTDAARERLARAEYDPSRLRSIEIVLEASDAVIVSTTALQEVLAARGVAATVVQNELDEEFWPALEVEANASGPVRALYMGSATHGDDLALLRPVFDALTTRNGRPVVLEVVGVTDGDDDWFDRLDIPEAHHPEFVRWLRESSSRWSVGVAPLSDDPFNRSKSDLKFLEYTLLGLPTVASAGESYRGIDEHGGILVGHSVDDWREAVTMALAGEVGDVDLATRYVRGQRMLGSTSTWFRTISPRA